MPLFMHPSLLPTPNNLLTASRMYSDPNLVVPHQIPARRGRGIPPDTQCCLFCTERIPALSGQPSLQSSCPPGTGHLYACRGDVGAHLEGPPAPFDVPHCRPWRSLGSGGVPADDGVAPLNHRFACVGFLESKGRTVDFEQHQRGGTHEGRRRDASPIC